MRFNKEKLGLILLFALTAGPFVALPLTSGHLPPPALAVPDVTPKPDPANIEIQQATETEKGNVIAAQKNMNAAVVARGAYEHATSNPADAIVIGDDGIPKWGEAAALSKKTKK